MDPFWAKKTWKIPWEAWKPLTDEAEYLISQEVNFPQHTLSSRFDFLEEDKMTWDQTERLRAVIGRVLLLYMPCLTTQRGNEVIINRLIMQYQPQGAYKP